MVSVAILVAIILVANSLLTSAQRTVVFSQANISLNSDARAAADRLRGDLAKLSKDGFLAIYRDGGGRKHLVFTTASPYRSIFDNNTIANAARIDYGLSSHSKPILWRRVILLDPTNVIPWQHDYEKMALAYYGQLSRANINTAIQGNYTYTYADGSNVNFPCMTAEPPMTMPPNSLPDVQALWPYLARPCTQFNVEWTAAGAISWNNTDETWTHADKTNWPAALRVTFTMGEGESERKYEVIIDLPQ